MNLEPINPVLLKRMMNAAHGVEFRYLATLKGDSWDFNDPRHRLFLRHILEAPGNLTEVFPLDGDDTPAFRVYKFKICLN